jgi:hypothetical protein
VTPPLHITGQPNADWIIFIVGAIVCLYWLRALRLARQGARLFLRNLLKSIIVFCGLNDVAHCHALENEFAAFSRTGHRWIRGVDRFWKIARQETVTIHPEGDEEGRHCKRFKG